MPMTMRLMTRKRLREYIEQPRNAPAKSLMLTWASTVEASTWTSFVELKQTFPAADHLEGETVCFDIGGNRWRIIANVSYQAEIVFLKWIGDHQEYDKL